MMLIAVGFTLIEYVWSLSYLLLISLLIERCISENMYLSGLFNNQNMDIVEMEKRLLKHKLTFILSYIHTLCLWNSLFCTIQKVDSVSVKIFIHEPVFSICLSVLWV